jgi:membrane protease YdiL (CAAX protease family)
MGAGSVGWIEPANIFNKHEECKEEGLAVKQKLPFIIFVTWALLDLAILLPVTNLLQGAFPIFTVAWIVVPLAAVLLSKNPSRIGFRAVSWREVDLVTAITLGGLLLLMLAFEPWSHTYQGLLGLALAGQPPDTTFAWLLRYSKTPALGGMFLYSGLVTLFGEELFFRGWLLQVFKRRWGAGRAIFLQAALFILPNLPIAFVLPPLQGILYGLVYTFLGIGVIGGWAASRTDSIWPSLISAAVCNLILVALIVK